MQSCPENLPKNPCKTGKHFLRDQPGPDGLKVSSGCCSDSLCNEDQEKLEASVKRHPTTQCYLEVGASVDGMSIGIEWNLTCSGAYCLSLRASDGSRKVSTKSCGEAMGCTGVGDIDRVEGGATVTGRCCKGDFCNHGAALPVVTLSAVAVAFLKLFMW
uniref:UPAR/Ly6 domain-containing protein n=1 Tax=Steinernema glaseri TaxID=37863 RepID=A0A1I7ZZC9_9BILA